MFMQVSMGDPDIIQLGNICIPEVQQCNKCINVVVNCIFVKNCFLGNCNETGKTNKQWLQQTHTL